MAAPKLGSGARFRKLSGTLASRGASNPDALAAWIGRKKYGAKKMGKLSAHAHANGNGRSVLDLAGGQLQCPNCGYRSDNADFQISGGVSGTSDSSSEALRTPAPSTGYVRNGAPLTVRGGGTAPGLASQASGIELAQRVPVSSPTDILVSRSATGTAVIRHRRGGALIGEIKMGDDGWQAVLGGQALQAHTHQRGALADLLGNWNRGSATLQRPAAESPPLQPAPVQTELMRTYGVPAIRTFATPATGSGNGPRSTYSAANSDNADSSSGDSDDTSSGGGLNPKGQAIYKKLKAKGWPDAKAMAFAKRGQNFGGGK